MDHLFLTCKRCAGLSGTAHTIKSSDYLPSSPDETVVRRWLNTDRYPPDRMSHSSFKPRNWQACMVPWIKLWYLMSTFHAVDPACSSFVRRYLCNLTGRMGGFKLAPILANSFNRMMIDEAWWKLTTDMDFVGLHWYDIMHRFSSSLFLICYPWISRTPIDRWTLTGTSSFSYFHPGKSFVGLWSALRSSVDYITTTGFFESDSVDRYKSMA